MWKVWKNSSHLSLAHNISGVKGVLEPQDGTRKIDKQFNYSLGPTQTKQQVA